MSSGHQNDSGPVGTGSRPQTMANMNRQRDAAAAANGGEEPERDWSQGGRLWHFISSIPLATLLILLTNFAMYGYELSDDDLVSQNCLNVVYVTQLHEYSRVLSNAYFHLGGIHIGMNMMAFYQIASTVEAALGTLVTLGIAMFFNLFIGVLYIFINLMAAAIMRKEEYQYSCAVGYSGVIFAFLAVDTAVSLLQGQRTRRVCMWDVPIVLYPILVLVGISLIMPRISWQGHLSGLIIGACYVKGVLLPFSPPRQLVLWLQERLVPAFLTEAKCWHAAPAVDPFDRFHPACLRGPFRCRCPHPPDVEGAGCAHVCVALINICRSVRNRGNRAGGQPVGRGAAGRNQVAAHRANALAARAGAPAVAAPGAPAAPGSLNSPSRSAPLLDPPSRSFPALPASLQAPPSEPSAPPRPSSQSCSDTSSDVLDGAVLGEGGSENGGEYSRLLPSVDDGGRSDQSHFSAASAPARASARPPPRLSSPTPSAPLLDPAEDLEMQPLQEL